MATGEAWRLREPGTRSDLSDTMKPSEQRCREAETVETSGAHRAAATGARMVRPTLDTNAIQKLLQSL